MMSTLEPSPEIHQPSDSDLHVVDTVAPPTTETDLHHVAQSTEALSITLKLLPEEKQALDHIFGLADAPADQSLVDNVREFVWDSYDLTIGTSYDQYTQLEKEMFEAFRAADTTEGQQWLSYHEAEQRLRDQLAASQVSFGRVVALGVARLSDVRRQMLSQHL